MKAEFIPLVDEITDEIIGVLPEDATNEDIDNALEKLKQKVTDDSEELSNTDAFAEELATQLEGELPDDITEEEIEEAIDKLKK